jgi:hypothetical protein
LKVRNRNSATFLVHNSAIDLVVRNIAELQRCGLISRTPTFGNRTSLKEVEKEKIHTVPVLLVCRCKSAKERLEVIVKRAGILSLFSGLRRVWSLGRD